MSRSTKKPFLSPDSQKSYKKIASKKIRKNGKADQTQGNAYRKLDEKWLWPAQGHKDYDPEDSKAYRK